MSRRLVAQGDRIVALGVGDLQRAVGREEVLGELLKACVAVLLEGLLLLLRLFRCEWPFEVVGCSREVGRHGRGKHHAVQARFAVSVDVARHFASAHRDANQCHVLQVAQLNDSLQVVGQRVVAVA